MHSQYNLLLKTFLHGPSSNLFKIPSGPLKKGNQTAIGPASIPASEEPKQELTSNLSKLMDSKPNEHV